MSVKILSVETSTESCSTALYTEDKVYVRHQIAPQEHSKLVLHMLDELLIEAEVALEDIDLLAFGAGPGSFTGLRIAAGVIQGLSFGINKPVVPVSTLQALAQSVYRRFGYTEVFAALDAKMQQIYCGFYKLDTEEIMQPCLPERVVYPSELTELPAEYKTQVWHGVGTGAIAYHKELETYMPYNILETTLLYPSALEIAKLASKIYLKQGGISAAQVIPVYLRNDVVKSIAKNNSK